MSHAARKMASKKCSLGKWVKKRIRKCRDSSLAENDHLLAKTPPLVSYSTAIRIREDFTSLVSTLQWKPSEKKKFNSLMEQRQYHDACLLIYTLEQNGSGDGSVFYKVIGQEMWRTVIQALDSERNQSAELQSIPNCIKWAKQHKCPNSPDWVPEKWQKEIENLFENYIIDNFPKFVSKRLDNGGLENHLVELERSLLHIIKKLNLLPEDLSASCLKCLRLVVRNHLMALADKNQDFKEHVLLYKWAQNQQKTLVISQYVSDEFDHLLFEQWFIDNGKKIKSIGQEKIHRALVEILQSEILWHSSPKKEAEYYFSDVPEKAASMCRAVEDLGDTLSSRVKSLFCEEFVYFVTRYEAFLKENVNDYIVSDNGICMGLRIVKNCYILRRQYNYLGSTSHDMKMKELLKHCENKGIDLVLSVLKPEIKEAFEKYFTKNSTEYENVLMQFQHTLKNENMQNDRMFNTLIYHRLVVLYIKSFFKCSKKLSHLNTGEIFSKGSKKLQDFFPNLVPELDLQDNNPLVFITNILTATGHESLRTTIIFFILEHPDLREEHLEAILKIKGNVSHKDMKELLSYIKEGKVDFEENKLCFFKDIDVGYSHGKMKRFLCCPPCCPC